MNKAIFLDRDGVINYDKGYVYKWEDFIFIEGVIESLKILQKSNYKLIIVTNQSGIGRKYFTEDEYKELTNKYSEFLNEKGINISGIYHCPHLPDNLSQEQCECRKPNPGLILKGAYDHKINLKKSIMIGDKISDMIAGRKAGINSLYLITSDRLEQNYNDDCKNIHLALNLLECALDINKRFSDNLL